MQSFSLWCKVSWIKFRPLAYLGPCHTSVMDLFCEYRWHLLGDHFFHRNDTSYMVDRALNASLKLIWYSNNNVLYAI